jgi:hypothetical protein
LVRGILFSRRSDSFRLSVPSAALIFLECTMSVEKSPIPKSESGCYGDEKTSVCRKFIPWEFRIL